VREIRPPGSVRGARGDSGSYRDSGAANLAGGKHDYSPRNELRGYGRQIVASGQKTDDTLTSFTTPDILVSER